MTTKHILSIIISIISINVYTLDFKGFYDKMREINQNNKS